MLSKRKEYKLPNASSMLIKSFGVVEMECNDGQDYLIAVTDDTNGFVEEYSGSKEVKRCKNKRGGWLACISKDLHDSMDDEFYDILINVVIPLYTAHEISLKSAVSAGKDIMNYREGNVNHFHDEASATDFYNIYKFLNMYREMINKMVMYSDASGKPSKDHNKIIDTAWKYLKQKECRLGLTYDGEKIEEETIPDENYDCT